MKILNKIIIELLMAHEISYQVIPVKIREYLENIGVITFNNSSPATLHNLIQTVSQHPDEKSKMSIKSFFMIIIMMLSDTFKEVTFRITLIRNKKEIPYERVIPLRKEDDTLFHHDEIKELGGEILMDFLKLIIESTGVDRNQLKLILENNHISLKDDKLTLKKFSDIISAMKFSQMKLSIITGENIVEEAFYLREKES